MTLELGIAIGHRQDYYLLFDPSKHKGDVPSDLGGIDRIQYTSYGTLSDGLTKLMLQEFGVPQEGRDMAAELEALRDRAIALLSKDKGLKIGEIGEKLGVPLEMAQVIVRPMVGDKLETTGTKRGMRYYLLGQAPKSRHRSAAGS